MKRAWCLLLLSLLVASQLFAQKSGRSTLRIRLSDDYPLTVAINGRYFEKVGKTLTIGDLPKKKHNIKVYRYRAYKDGKGGKAELVYSGKIKIEPGGIYDCIVDVDTRKFRLKKVLSLTGPSGRSIQDVEVSVDMPPTTNVQRSAALSNLKQNIDAEDEDADKLKLAKQFLTTNTVTTANVRDIASWLFFDDTRLDFVKYAYQKVADKVAYTSLSDIFTLESSRQEFKQFLAEK